MLATVIIAEQDGFYIDRCGTYKLSVLNSVVAFNCARTHAPLLTYYINSDCSFPSATFSIIDETCVDSTVKGMKIRSRDCFSCTAPHKAVTRTSGGPLIKDTIIYPLHLTGEGEGSASPAIKGFLIEK